MRYLSKSVIKHLLKIAPMQAKLNELLLQIENIEEQLEANEFDETLKELNSFQSSLEITFSNPEKISVNQYPILENIQNKVNEITNKLIKLQSQKRQDITKLIKNKKKVGIYNQIK